ncbi:MAG: threonine-phosphate decarboxylase CobD [Steroidobacteraceae bacterium]
MSAAPDLSAFHRHGGRIRTAEALFPDAPRPWLDLSTGINPHRYPAPAPRRADLARLPDPEAIAELEAAAAIVFGADPAQVAATPGTDAALRLLPRLIGVRSVEIAEPTYGGHRDAWSAIGAEIRPSGAVADAWVIVNPNNPDGRVTPPEALTTAAASRWVIVDEAFVDPDPAASVAAQASGRLIVLRSFGKFYGLPGVRLGFIVANPTIAQDVRRAFGDWPISTDALLAGRAAYTDACWRARTHLRLARGRRRLDQQLGRSGLEIVGGTDLFRLARADDAKAVFLRLARAGVLCRPFDDPQLLRFGLPGSRAASDRLAAALMKGHS